jgi:hypothetical protein
VIRGWAAVRCLALAASLALSLGACSDDEGGSGSEAPANASKEEFCGAFNDLFDDVLAKASTDDSAAAVRALKKWAADIGEIGTPAEMPDDARNGFEVFVDQTRDLDEDATLADLEKFGEDVSDSDRADAEAFSDWTQDNCPLDLPSPSPSE